MSKTSRQRPVEDEEGNHLQELEIETTLEDARRVVKQATVSTKLDLGNEDWNGDGNAGNIHMEVVFEVTCTNENE